VQSDVVISLQPSDLGARLDEDHLPETNGRMAVCRRCGIMTESSEGRQHRPAERQLAQANEWLDLQTRMAKLARSLHPHPA
jgi:hypothetical protein